MVSFFYGLTTWQGVFVKEIGFLEKKKRKQKKGRKEGKKERRKERRKEKKEGKKERKKTYHPRATSYRLNMVFRLLVGLEEDIVCILDGASLPVRVCIHANEITSLDDLVIGRVGPRIIRVYMTDFGLDSQRSHHTSHIINLLSKCTRYSISAIEILAADGNGQNPISAMSVNCRF